MAPRGISCAGRMGASGGAVVGFFDIFGLGRGGSAGLTTNRCVDDDEWGGVNIFVNLFEIYDATTSITEFVPTELELALR